MNKQPSICYLCRKPLLAPLSNDHVPPRQLYPKDVRKTHRPNLLTIPVHNDCNYSYQYDEDYFVNTLAPFAQGSYAGEALLKEVFRKYGEGKKQGLIHKIAEEFEHRPSGLILPPSLVAKRLEGQRVYRVAWKIVRGLYFHHFEKALPEQTPNDLKIVLPDQTPPQEFLVGLADAISHGQYPGVFDYKFSQFPEVHNFNYWAMLLWDRIIIIAAFHDPNCDCNHCSILKKENHA